MGEIVEAAGGFGSELSWVEDDFADEVGPAVVGGGFDFGFDDADLADGEFGGGHGNPRRLRSCGHGAQQCCARTFFSFNSCSAHGAEFFGLDFVEDADFAGLAERIFRIAEIFVGEAVDVIVGAFFGDLDDLAADFEIAIGIFGIDDRERRRADRGGCLDL